MIFFFHIDKGMLCVLIRIASSPQGMLSLSRYVVFIKVCCLYQGMLPHRGNSNENIEAILMRTSRQF